MWDRPGYPLGPPVFALVKCVRHIATTQRQARRPVPRRVLRCAVMPPAHRAPCGLSLLAGVLIAAFLAQAFLASAIKSPVFDETGDIAAGLSYVQSGEVRANLQHPPLLKEMAGAALWLAGVRLPASPQVLQMLADGGGERTVGSQLIAANGPDRTMFWARLPFLLLTAALGVLLYLWGRQLLGGVAALAALFLYTLDPTILRHGRGTPLGSGVAAPEYENVPVKRSVLRIVACGVAMGLMLTPHATMRR